jgi:hypothetical protein
MPAASGKPTAPAKPTPTSKPTPAPANLVFDPTLSYSTNVCYANVTDADGHSLWGAILKISVTVKNAGEVASATLWLVLKTSSGSVTAMKASGMPSKVLFHDGAIGLLGPSIAAGKSQTLNASVFVEAPYRIDFEVYALHGIQAEIESAYASASYDGSWTGLWASVSIC